MNRLSQAKPQPFPMCAEVAKWVVGLAFAFAILVPRWSAAQDRFELRGDDVVVFLGGANMTHLQQAGYFEAMLTASFADAQPKFRDLSWEGDTVFHQQTEIERWRKDGFGDLNNQLKRLGTTVVIAQFGRSEALQEVTDDEFERAYATFIDRIQKHCRLVVLVSPTPFEKPNENNLRDLTPFNHRLRKYVERTAKIAHDKKAIFVDLFTGEKKQLTTNGMHLTPESQSYIARQIADGLGVEPIEGNDFDKLRLAVIEKHRLWYDYWRPANWKLLFGDDSRRQFTRGGTDYIPFREEWTKLLALIERAEERVWRIALGKSDPGLHRPPPEKLHGDPAADIQKELESFTTLDGFQVNLFASEKEGLTSPLAVRWDSAGRMLVTVTTTYPHVFPGDIPNDKIIVLEDSDHNGVADKSHVFADGLNIPTAFELGDGGVYVGQNSEILFLKDTTGNGEANHRQVLLGGFGNGDSHQTTNSFVWSPGGELFMGQGDGIESRVETPWGVSELFQSGFYRLQPRRLKLAPLLNDFMGPGNPWGVAFDRWGQIFSIDGAGGVTFLSPGQIPAQHKLRLPTIGKPGGYCGIGYLESEHLPIAMNGQFVVGDFKSNRIKRFSVANVGGGFSLQWEEPLLHSSHRNFRPVDVKQGPDGAIYIVDWYNPITCHQDDAYRDPTRDKAHGRIWRVTSSRPTVNPINLQTANDKTVVAALASFEAWTRYHAKREMTNRNTAKMAEALDAWVASLDRTTPKGEHQLYEALGAFATIEVVRPELLKTLLTAEEPFARAFACRMTRRWHDRLENPLHLLAPGVVDEHPLVRLEAIAACSAIPSPHAIEVIARASDLPMNDPLNYTFTQACFHSSAEWRPAFERGEIEFANPNHLAAVFSRTGGKNALQLLKDSVNENRVAPQARYTAIRAILALGGFEEWVEYGLDTKHYRKGDSYHAVSHAHSLEQLAKVTQSRSEKPSQASAKRLVALIEQPHIAVKTNAIALAGLWRVEGAFDAVATAANAESLPDSVRDSALLALSQIDAKRSRELLVKYATDDPSQKIRSSAITALAHTNPKLAGELAVRMFQEQSGMAVEHSALLLAFVDQKDGAKVLASVIASANVSPEVAEQLLHSLYSTGRREIELENALQKAIGALVQPPEYSEAFVNALVIDSAKSGDPERGEKIFSTSGCIQCHRIDGKGGIVGPDLSSIGGALATERIAEEILWPARQVKEGYSLLSVLTDDGKVTQGFLRSSRQSQSTGDVVLRKLDAEEIVVIPHEKIEEIKQTGSPMPSELTHRLSRGQLLDLLRFVSSQGGKQ